MLSSAAMLAISLVIFAATCALLVWAFGDHPPPSVALAGFGLSALVAMWGTVRGARSLFQQDRAIASGRAAAIALAATAGNLVMAGIGALGVLLSTVSFTRGRQLRRFGRVYLPRIVPGSSWAHTKITVSAETPVPDDLARRWRENGRTEHASVAAFARLALDLMALGAPPRLVASANSDALDEIRHAELCFSLARSLDGRIEDPGPFPEAKRANTLPRARTLALAMLAVDSLIDGALHEGVSARIIAKLAKRSDVPAIRGVLKEIASDEGRHAAHGWDVAEWCLEQGRAPVAHALRGALRTLPREMRSFAARFADGPMSGRSGFPPDDGSWERWGIHGATLEREEYAAGRAYVIERVEKMIAAASHAA